MTKRVFFERVLKPLSDSVKLAIGRAVLRAVNDAGVLQRVQIEALAGELLWADRIQNYGFYSNPPLGADEYLIPGVGIVAAGHAFRLPDGRQFNSAWLAGASEADLTAIGAHVVTRAERPAVDPRYYMVSEVQEGANITYEVTALPAAQILALRLADLAAMRYSVETAGIVLEGATIRTDEASQAKVNGAYAMVQLNPALVIDWKAANGWAQLSAATMTAIAAAVGAHVQACYSAERAHGEALQALAASGDIEVLITYDIADGWPPTAADEEPS